MAQISGTRSLLLLSSLFPFKIANKRRPKKTRGLHYKKYTYGASAEESNIDAGSDISDDENTSSDLNNNLDDIDGEKTWCGPIWPLSNFQKIDVLKVAISIRDGVHLSTPFRSYQDGLKLPFEIIVLILEQTEDFVSVDQLLICKAMYHTLLPRLYEFPKLGPKNFSKFVDTISNTTHRKKYSKFVKILNLAEIIQSGKNSYISKLLRKFSSSLEILIAPQTSFGLSPLISLRSCHNLKVLDLGLVSETVNLKELFLSIRNAPNLEELSFPRSSVSCEDFDSIWPQNLWYLKLSGGISNQFLLESRFPNSITSLEFSHCPNINGEAICNLLMNIGMNLKRLSIFYPMPKLSQNSLDPVFLYCPNLTFLYLNIEYITKDAFDEELLVPLEEYERPLQTLCIDSSGLLGQGFKIHPDDITIALCEDRLPCLRKLKVAKLLGWDFSSDDVQDLVGELENRDGSVFTF